jgi:hypothetical protein
LKKFSLKNLFQNFSIAIAFLWNDKISKTEKEINNMKKHTLATVFVAVGILMASTIWAKPAVAEDLVAYQEAFGAASGLALYDVQIIIGVTADAYAKNVYTAEETNSIINEQKNALSVLSDYVNKLRELPDESEENLKSLNKISDCISKLGDTADALIGYTADETEENANKFDENRKASYAALAELLGFNK